MTKKVWRINLIVLALFILDRILKKLFLAKILIAQKFWFFNFYLYRNPELIFGLPADNFLVIFLTASLLGFLIFKLKEAYLKKELALLTIYALIVVGAISNIFDRLFYGLVIDYLSLGAVGVFNLADLMIWSGVIALVIETWRR